MAVSFLGASVATDFIFRHEVERQARRELHKEGLEVNVNGINKAIREEKLDLFAHYETAGIDFGGSGEEGMTPLNTAILADNSEALDLLFLRKTEVKPSVDLPAKDGITPLKRALAQRDFELADRLMQELGAELGNEKSPGLPWLVDAMNQGDIEMRDYLLSKGVDVNDKGDQPYHPFAMAARDDDLALMERLVSLGAKINVPGTGGKPLLIESALQSEYDEMAFLLEHGANPDVSESNEDPLLIAMKREDRTMKDLLLKHDATIDRAGPSGKHFLFEAYENGDREWLTYLLDAGISVDLKSKQQRDTLLLQSIRNHDYEMVDFLIDRKADTNLPDRDGITPLQDAVTRGDTAMVRTLVEKGAQIHPLPMMATVYKNRDNPTMNLLMNAGVDPNIELQGTGQRVFDMAVADQAFETARTLLEAKADIGESFWVALTTGQDELVAMFLERGVDAAAPGPDGKTPLEYILSDKRFHMVRPILDAGGHSSPMYSDNESWLSRTVRNGNSEIALALIKAGIDLGDERAADGHSLLGWSIANDMDDVSLALIEAGADVNVIEPSPAHDDFIAKFEESATFRKLLKNDKKIRPLMMTSVLRNHEVAQAMVNAGAQNHVSSKYYYPISIASWYADVRMMQIIYGRDPDVQPRKLVVDLSSQTVKLYQNGAVTYSSVCSTGMSGYRTKTGTFVITQKNRHHTSSIYDASMPYFMRLSCSDFGFHIGHCPGYAASHGCIRLPSAAARHYFSTCSLGDMVVIKD
ncbi:MAG: ankyrin repeat domain-containing protein [Verrucomicrobiales bacterium]|nr:ankyrin repeat domain-containing protein [Verrucomicrobiales bacterium]